MFYLERFHDLGATYVIVDAREFRRSRWAGTSSLERVSKGEARWVLSKIIRQDSSLFARLYEALTGTRPSCARGFRVDSVANTDALLGRMLDAFGADGLSSGPSAHDFAHFYLLRERRTVRSTGSHIDTPQSRRMAQALTAFGRTPFTHRGETYQLQRAGTDATLAQGHV